MSNPSMQLTRPHLFVFFPILSLCPSRPLSRPPPPLWDVKEEALGTIAGWKQGDGDGKKSKKSGGGAFKL